MSDHKTFFGKILEKIGNFFEGLFNAAERAWDKLEPEVQKALLQGSGVIDIINANIDEAPDFVFQLIQQRFPDLTEEKLKEGLAKLSEAFKIAGQTENPDLLTTIKNLQAFLATLNGKFWEGVSSTLAQFLAVAFSPDETPFAKISMLIEYVYQKFFKK